MDIAAVTGVVIGDSDLDGRAVTQGIEVLDYAFSVGLGADKGSCPRVLDRAGQNLGGAGGIAVYKDNERDIEICAGAGIFVTLAVFVLHVRRSRIMDFIPALFSFSKFSSNWPGVTSSNWLILR